jgi:circadian clock protein KaiB
MMPRKQLHDRSKDYEKALENREKEKYVLRLYVAGLTPASQRAILNVQSICEQYLEGRYDLEVIDIYKQPVLKAGDQIIAVPTLVKKLPAPLRKFIGDLSDQERILVGLDLKKKAST